MPGGTFAERMAATGQAIKHQQQVAKHLVGALAELAMETERMAAHIRGSDLAQTEVTDEPMDMDMVMPGCPPEQDTSMLRQAAKLQVRNVWCDPAPQLQVRAKSTVSDSAAQVKVLAKSGVNDKMRRGSFLQECAETLAAEKKQTGRRMFADPEELREQIREHLTEEIFDVSTLYKDAGICQAMLRSSAFETASMILVIVSSGWMAVEIDHNDSTSLHEADAIFQVVSHSLCLLFSAEILVRIFAFRHPRDALTQRWIVFDLVLVMLAVFEVWVLGTVAAVAGTTMGGGGMKFILIFRVLRLLRILRLARVFHYLPELLVIVRGLGRAVRAIIVVLLLIGIIIFVASMIFKALLDGSTLGSEMFSTVSASMATLMLDCTLSGSRGTAIMRAAWDVSPIFGIMMLLFVLVSNVTMLGVLTGLLVQTVKTVAEVEKEEKSVKQLVSYMEELWQLMLGGDGDDDGKINIDEFTELLADKNTARLLLALDVDVEGLASVAQFVFQQHHGNLGRKEFLQMVLDVRNSNKATVKDHIETRKFTEATLHGMLYAAAS